MSRIPHPVVAAAKQRLDRLDWYPRPVEIRRVRLAVTPGFFRLPYLRRFHGYAMHNLILVRDSPPSADLVCHELCHVWQMQHRPIRMPLTYLVTPYRTNPYEVEARRAVELTRP
jgi:hypothetical protein